MEEMAVVIFQHRMSPAGGGDHNGVFAHLRDQVLESLDGGVTGDSLVSRGPHAKLVWDLKRKGKQKMI